MTRIYFSLGSNVGDRAGHLTRTCDRLAAYGTVRTSPWYETAPWGGVEQDNFWNLVVELEFDQALTPAMLWDVVTTLEDAEQRVRDVRWGPRTLDVDVIWIDDLIWHDPLLTVPHPRMWERRFVLAPLRDLRPDLVSEAHYAASSGDVARLDTLS